jgi:hypothetical protein
MLLFDFLAKFILLKNKLNKLRAKNVIFDFMKYFFLKTFTGSKYLHILGTDYIIQNQTKLLPKVNLIFIST